MRHQKKRHKLGRTAPHRKATMVALSSALIRHKRITTTIPKAKALRVFIEPLITRAKEDTTHNRRQVFRKLQDNASVTELFTEISGQVGDRPGGYTRIVKLGRRAGDGAAMAVIELVDYNDVQPDGTSSGSKRTRRGSGRGRRGGRSRRGAEQTAAAATAAADSTADTPDAGTDEGSDVTASAEVAENLDARRESADPADTTATGAADVETDAEPRVSTEQQAPDAPESTEQEAADAAVSTEQDASDAADVEEEETEGAADVETEGKSTDVVSEPAVESDRADDASEERASASADEATMDQEEAPAADTDEDAPESSSASSDDDEEEDKK